MSVPTSLPRWATDPSAEITEPPSQQKDTGWVQEDIPPHETFNWFWNLVYQWIAHLAGASAKYTKLEDAVDGLTAGDTAIVDEFDLDQAFGTQKTLVSLAGAPLAIAVDGKGVVVLHQDGGGSSVMYRYSRADLTTVLATYTMAGTEISRVVTNGSYVVTMTSTTVRCYAIAGGAAVWTYTHDSTVLDLAIDGTRVYMVGAEGATFKSLRAITLATGAVAWSYSHGATLNQVATNGRQVFVGGAAGTGGYTHRAIEAANGKDLTGSGGVGISTEPVVWELTATLTSAQGCMVTDGRRLYVGFAVGVGDEVEAWSMATGAKYSGIELGATCRDLAVDSDYLYVGLDANPGVAAFDKQTLQMVWYFSDGASPSSSVCVASDSAAVFVAGNGTELRRIYRGNRPKVWRRVDPTNNYLPYRQLIIPEE